MDANISPNPLKGDDLVPTGLKSPAGPLRYAPEPHGATYGMNYDSNVSPRFNDPKNITVGQARVIYAPAIGYFKPEGWVLIGGLRTTDEAEALAHAVAIDRMMGGMA